MKSTISESLKKGIPFKGKLKGSGKWIFIILATVAILSVICIALFVAAYSSNGKNKALSFIPVEILTKPDDKLKQIYDTNVDNTIAALDSNTANSLSLGKGGDIKFNLNANTADNKNKIDAVVDVKNDQTTGRVSSNIKANVKFSSGIANIELNNLEANYIYADNFSYAQLVSLPDDLYTFLNGLVGQDVKSKLDNKWIKIDAQKLKDQYKISTDSTTGNLSKQDIKDILTDSKNYRFFHNSKLIGRESVNGLSTIHYSTNIDLEQVQNFVKSSLQKHDKNITADDLKSFDNSFNDFKSTLNINSLNIYSGVSDDYVYKEALNMTLMSSSNVLSKEIKNLGDTNINLNFETKETDKSQKIDIPSVSTDIIDLINSFSGGSTVKNAI